jgi:hypothetical protein
VGHNQWHFANAFLETAYWADHNHRFARAPASTDDFHVAVPRGLSLETVFRLEETRTVSNDWVVRYANRLLQLERHSQQPPARSTVQVFENAAGQIDIHYRDRRMRWTEIVPPLGATSAAGGATPALSRPPTSPSGRSGPGGHSADHPWHHAVPNHYRYQQAAKDRRAWARGQP